MLFGILDHPAQTNSGVVPLGRLVRPVIGTNGNLTHRGPEPRLNHLHSLQSLLCLGQ